MAVCIGHQAANLGEAALVVISSAIPERNPELTAARAAGLPVLRRAEMLARVMAMRRGIAVAGTHGKTTTSSMISHVLHRCGLQPTFLVGGELNDIGSNAGVGQGEWLVAEADESDGSLLYLRPEVAVVSNVELDHHAHYRLSGRGARRVRALRGTAARRRPAGAWWRGAGARPWPSTHPRARRHGGHRPRRPAGHGGAGGRPRQPLSSVSTQDGTGARRRSRCACPASTTC